MNKVVNKTVNTDAVFLRQAESKDIEALKALLDRCYRGTEGWTHEADLVGGIRTTAAELAAIISDPKHYIFIYPKTDTGARGGQETGELLGCIAVELKMAANSSHDGYIGMFAVHPQLQGAGVGHVILSAAESFATRHLLNTSSIKQQSSKQVSRLTMSILSHRPELLAYYQRRGYQLTGRSFAFPVDGNNGEPKRDDLELLELAKPIASTP